MRSHCVWRWDTIQPRIIDIRGIVEKTERELIRQFTDGDDPLGSEPFVDVLIVLIKSDYDEFKGLKHSFVYGRSHSF